MTSGPVFLPRTHAIRARPPRPPRGRARWNAGLLPPGTPVIQWTGTCTQLATFGTTAPALESVVVALTPASGTGYPTPGNWLFCVVGMNESSATAAATVGVGDDIHSYWRPGPVSTSAALTRTAIWYTPNTARQAGYVYVAPNGAFDALTVTVVEVAGLGPWDTVTGTATNYSAAATSLNLALGSPSASPAFTIAAVAGDDTTAGQAFAPSGWTKLTKVQVTNGSDHTTDSVLTAAILPSTSGSISVNASSSAENLSGAILQVQQNAPSPIPAAQNPAWPYMKFEAAFGGGFQTPQDSLTWTDLTSRLWSWNETTGIQYQLGQIQATQLDLELDNFDGALSSDNPSSPYAGLIKTGVPLRIRAAVGTIGGQAVNRWYVISRNAEEWPQQVDPAYRRRVVATGTDIWSVLASSGPSPYRGEIEQDSPYAWWPADDQPLTGGVLPASLRNAAFGNTNVLNIVISPSGAVTQFYYNEAGTTTSTFAAPSAAVYTVAANTGWMFGDPPSSPQSYATSNPVTSNPGSASWQAAGEAGNTGSDGWFLSCNDAGFPPLASGVTVEGWFNCTFYGSGNGLTTSAVVHPVTQQPEGVPLTLFELATGSNPVAKMQLDTSGNLNLITYNGASPTSHSIYTSSDLRGSSWFHVALVTDGSTWTVYLNGGATAAVSGSGAGMTSGWTWLIADGDLAANGGSSAGTGLVNGGNMSVAHLAVYGSQLPAWRLLAHYVAAVTGFGVLPAPTAVSPQFINTGSAGGAGVIPGYYAPDGTAHSGTFNQGGGGFFVSAVVTANAPTSTTSGPSARATAVAWATGGTGSTNKGSLWVSWAGVAPSFTVYTSSAVGTETSAAVVNGSGDSFTSGYGAAAAGAGVCQTGGGAGASPPASASALGDTVQQRIERVLGYGHATWPGRCIDPAALAVQAATDIGGQQAGSNVQSIAQSDGGLLYVDNLGNLTYWQKSHLAAQYTSPVWTITPDAPPGPGGAETAPYYREEFNWLADPHRVWNAILITPFSPDGSSLASITPSQASQVATSQAQYGAQPRQITSYLQSQTEMQSQADWIFSNFGQAQIRVEGVRIAAAPDPVLFPLVLGINIGDVVSVQNWQIGGGGITGTFRVSNIRRRIAFGGDDPEDGPVAEVVLQLDYEPSSYWG